MNREAVIRKIQQYQEEREQVIKTANEQIIALGGAIAALEQLLKEEEPEQTSEECL